MTILRRAGEFTLGYEAYYQALIDDGTTILEGPVFATLKECQDWADTWEPDLDNWMKGFTDCLVRGLFVRDDALVVSLRARKVFVPPDMAGVYVELNPIPPGWGDCVLADMEDCR